MTEPTVSRFIFAYAFKPRHHELAEQGKFYLLDEGMQNWALVKWDASHRAPVIVVRLDTIIFQPDGSVHTETYARKTDQETDDIVTMLMTKMLLLGPAK